MGSVCSYIKSIVILAGIFILLLSDSNPLWISASNEEPTDLQENVETETSIVPENVDTEESQQEENVEEVEPVEDAEPTEPTQEEPVEEVEPVETQQEEMAPTQEEPVEDVEPTEATQENVEEVEPVETQQEEIAPTQEEPVEDVEPAGTTTPTQEEEPVEDVEPTEATTPTQEEPVEDVEPTEATQENQIEEIEPTQEENVEPQQETTPPTQEENVEEVEPVEDVEPTEAIQQQEPNTATLLPIITKKEKVQQEEPELITSRQSSGVDEATFSDINYYQSNLLDYVYIVKKNSLFTDTLGINFGNMGTRSVNYIAGELLTFESNEGISLRDIRFRNGRINIRKVSGSGPHFGNYFNDKSLYIAKWKTGGEVIRAEYQKASGGGGFTNFNVLAGSGEFVPNDINGVNTTDVFFIGIGSKNLAEDVFTVIPPDSTPPTLTLPSSIGRTRDSTPDFSFTSDEAGTITYAGGCSSSSTTAIDGRNTITLTKSDGTSLSDGDYYNCRITVTDTSSNVRSLDVPAFTIDTTSPTVSSHSLSQDGVNEYADVGDTLTLTLETNELVTSSVTIAGQPATPTFDLSGVGNIDNNDPNTLLYRADNIFVQGDYAYVISGNNTNSLQVIDISNPAEPMAEGNITHGQDGTLLSGAYDLFVQGDYAYVVSIFSNSLQVIDISNPSNPRAAGNISDSTFLDRPEDVFVQGNYAYVISQGSNPDHIRSLQVIKISEPDNDRNVTLTAIGNNSDGENGRLLNSPRDVFVQGNYAYVISQNPYSLQIIRIFDEVGNVNLTPVGNISQEYVSYAPITVSVQGDYAYVILRFNALSSLQVIDISDPVDPRSAGNIETLYLGALNVSIQGNYAYVVSNGTYPDYIGSLQVIEISEPDDEGMVTLTPAGNIENGEDGALLSRSQGVSIQGNYAYVTSYGFNALQIIELKNTYELEVTDTTPRGLVTYVVGTLTDLAGNILAGFSETSEDIRVGEPDTTPPILTLPSSIGRTRDSTPNFSFTSDEAGTITYAGGCSSSSTTAIDGRNTITLTKSDGTSLSDGIYHNCSITVTDASSNVRSLAVPTFTIDTTSPTVSSHSLSQDGANTYADVGDTLTLTLETNELVTSSVTIAGQPATPTFDLSGVGNVDGTDLNPLLDRIKRISVQGNYAYVISENSNALQVIDISTPSTPTPVGNISHNGSLNTLLNSPRNIFVQGNYAYVASWGSNALQVIDISNPAEPRAAGNIDGSVENTLLSRPTGVSVQGNYAYVTSRGSSPDYIYTLQIIEISEPDENGDVTLTPVGNIDDSAPNTSLNGAGSLFVQGNYAYVVSPDFDTLQIIDISNPADPTAAGKISHGENGALLDYPTDVFVQGNYAYVASWFSDTLQVIDISTPSTPTPAGKISHGENGALLDGVFGVSVQGNYAYVVSSISNALQVIDISDYINERTNKSLTPAGNISHNIGSDILFDRPQGISVQGNYVYVASEGSYPNYDSALQIIELKNTYELEVTDTTPRGLVTYVVGTLTDLAGNILAGFSETSEDIRVGEPDTTPPILTLPSSIGRTRDSTPNFSFTSDEAGTITYAGGCSSSSTTAIDGRNTITLTKSDGTSLSDGIYHNCSITVTDASSNVRSLAVPTFTIDTTSPTVSSHSLSQDGANTYADVGDTLTLTLETNELVTSSVTIAGQPATPTFDLSGVGNIDGLETPVDVFVQGNYAYVTSQSSGFLQIIDISTQSPMAVGAYRQNPIFIVDVFVQGNYAYVTGENIISSVSTFQIIDISDPTAPTAGSDLNILSDFPNDIFVQGNYAYVVFFDALQIIDISDPTTPIAAGNIDNSTPNTLLNGASSVFVQGNYAYVASYGFNALQIIDISDPTTPTAAGNIDNSAPNTLLDSPRGVFVQGNYAYVVSQVSDALQIIDISDPTTPTAAGNISDSAPNTLLNGADDVFVQGNYAYITSSSSDALQIIDISNPSTPTAAGNIDNSAPNTLLSGPTGVSVQGNYAYVTSYGFNALQIIELKNTYELEVTDSTPRGLVTYVVGTLTDLAGNILAGFSETSEDIRVGEPDTTPPTLTLPSDIGTTNISTPDFSFTSDEAGTITYIGNCISPTTGAIVGENTITFNSLAEGNHNNCSITVTDSADNVSESLDVPDFTIDTISPTITLTSDEIGVTKNRTPVVIFTSNEVGAIAYSGGCSSSTTTAIVGTNTITFNSLANGDYSCGITVTDSADNFGSLTIPTFTIDATAPILNSLTSFIGIINGINNIEPIFSFTSNEAGTITYIGNCISPTTVAIVGTNTITFGSQDGMYTNCSITVTDSADNVSALLAIPIYIIDKTNPGLSSVIPTNSNSPSTYVKAGDTIELALTFSEDVTRPAVTVNGRTGSQIEINNSDDADGNTWTAIYTVGENDINVDDAPYTITATDPVGNIANFTDNTGITIDTKAPTLTLPSSIGVTKDKTPDFSFTSNEAGTITYSGGCSSSETSVEIERKTITLTNPNNSSGLEDGDYTNCRITVTDSIGNARNLTIPTFTIDRTRPSVISHSLTSSRSGTFAETGDTLTLTLETNEPVASSATIAGQETDFAFKLSGVGNIVNGGNIALNGPQSVFVQGNYAYVTAEGSDSLQIINISNPTTPTAAGTITHSISDNILLDKAKDVFVQGNYAYVVSYDSDSLQIIETSEPNDQGNVTLTPVGNISHNIDSGILLSGASGVFVQGNYAYVVSYDSDSLQIIETSEPNDQGNVTLTPVGNISHNIDSGTLLSFPSDVFVQGNYAYVTAEGSDSLQIINISNPTTPTAAGNIDNSTPNTLLSFPSDVFVQGNYAYVTAYGSDALQVIKISEPNEQGAITLTPVGNIQDRFLADPNNLLNGPTSVFVQGNYAYIASRDESALQVIKISEPDVDGNVTLTLAGNIIHGGDVLLNRATGVSVQGNYAYVTSYDSDALQIIELKNTYELEVSDSTREGLVTYDVGLLTDLADNTFNPPAQTSNIIIDRIAPSLTLPSSIGRTGDSTPDFSFTSNETGTITYSGGCSSSTTGAIVGENTITFNSLEDNTYTLCTVTVTDTAGNAGSLAVPIFTIDTTAPTVSITNVKVGKLVDGTYIDVTVPQSGANAIETDRITVNFTTSEKLSAAPTVTIAGQNATVTGTDTTWTAIYIVASGINSTNAQFDVATITDTVSNSDDPDPMDTNVNIDTDGVGIENIEFTTNNPNSTPTKKIAKAEDTITVNVTFTESVSTPTIKIAGQPVTVTGSGTTWEGRYVVGSSITSDNAGYTIVVFDLSNNRADLNGSTEIKIDTTAPTVSSVNIENTTPGSPNPDNYARENDNVRIEITLSEEIKNPNSIGLNFPSESNSIVATKLGDIYTTSIRVDSNTPEGLATYNVGPLTDLAGNVFDPEEVESDFVIDRSVSRLILSSVGISDIANGKRLTLTIQTNEEVTISGAEMDGNALEFTRLDDTYSYTSSIDFESEPIANIFYKIGTLTDLAGNEYTDVENKEFVWIRTNVWDFDESGTYNPSQDGVSLYLTTGPNYGVNDIRRFTEPSSRTNALKAYRNINKMLEVFKPRTEEDEVTDDFKLLIDVDESERYVASQDGIFIYAYTSMRSLPDSALTSYVAGGSEETVRIAKANIDGIYPSTTFSGVVLDVTFSRIAISGDVWRENRNPVVGSNVETTLIGTFTSGTGVSPVGETVSTFAINRIRINTGDIIFNRSGSKVFSSFGSGNAGKSFYFITQGGTLEIPFTDMSFGGGFGRSNGSSYGRDSNDIASNIYSNNLVGNEYRLVIADSSN